MADYDDQEGADRQGVPQGPLPEITVLQGDGTPWPRPKAKPAGWTGDGNAINTPRGKS